MQAILYLLIFFFSGIAGLIYESIWSHYLKLFLGHAAYAQTLVLAIYMGGMAAGAWIAGSRINKLRNLLSIYAVIEILLGISALVFHDLFIRYQDLSYQLIMPHLNGKTEVLLYKWITSSLLILPQSILLGATFPLMAAGYIRQFPGSSGHHVATLYFSNTFGASLGVLLSGFYLIENFGLKGTIVAAGIIDLLVGCTMLLLNRRLADTVDVSTPPLPEKHPEQFHLTTTGFTRQFAPLFVIAFLTAVSSFIYEIGWIRMLSLVLGSSTHSFEMMLSTFILGMALGSLFIRKRIDRIVNLPRAIVYAQIAMGFFALLSILIYGNMFRLMQFFMSAFRNTDQGYLFFNIAGDFICMLVMLPSTICAGMVLPLVIHYFYRHGTGEQHIGKIYAINTFGGIIGIAISVWLLMPLTGVRFLVTIGGCIDIAIGLYILYVFRETRTCQQKQLLSAIAISSIIILVAFGKINPAFAVSGVFRNGTLSSKVNMLSYVDGRTATISLFKTANNIVLSTNGKPDAAINYQNGICGDEYTMTLTGVLPLSIMPEHADVAVIGLGSGMTSHFLLFDTTLASLDIVEIEKEIADAAVKIGNKVSKTFTDQRSHIHIDDAKSFFSTSNKRYDCIISEPSNPWVSGVSGLFSAEFFERIKSHLTDNGILVQWFHCYESDVSIVMSILGALQLHFPVYQLYMAGSDCIIIAGKNPAIDLSLKRDLFVMPLLAKELEKLHFISMNDLALLKFASDKVCSRMLNVFPAPANSDFSPYVDLNAVRYRYLDTRIDEFDTLLNYIIPVRKLLLNDTETIKIDIRDTVPELSNFKDVFAAKKLLGEITDTEPPISADISSYAVQLDYLLISDGNMHFDKFFDMIISILEKTLPYLSLSETSDLWTAIEAKSISMTLTDNDKEWMSYFRSLCHYNLPELYNQSISFLPDTGIIEDTYLNRMLLVTLYLSAGQTGNIAVADRYFARFASRHAPGMMLEIVRNIPVNHSHTYGK